jgi:hypothetical protein
VIDAYALMLASMLLTGGSLGDILGRRLVFASGLVLFSAASLTGALATTPLFLNLARRAGHRRRVHVRDRAGADSAGVPGPRPRDGVRDLGRHGRLRRRGRPARRRIADRDARLAVDLLHQPPHRPRDARRHVAARSGAIPAHRRDDRLASVVLWTSALFLLVFALIRGNDEGWSSPQIVGLLAGSAVLFVAFALVERAIDHPMFELRLFSIPTFTGGSIVAFTIAASLFAMFLYLTLYLQNVLGLSPLETGVRFLPLSMISFVVAAISGPHPGALPQRPAASSLG